LSYGPCKDNFYILDSRTIRRPRTDLRGNDNSEPPFIIADYFIHGQTIRLFGTISRITDRHQFNDIYIVRNTQYCPDFFCFKRAYPAGRQT